MGAPANFRRHHNLSSAVDYLRQCGADEIDIATRKNGRGHLLRFAIEGCDVSLAVPHSTGCPKVQVTMMRQQIRRRLKESGIEVRA